MIIHQYEPCKNDQKYFWNLETNSNRELLIPLKHFDPMALD